MPILTGCRYTLAIVDTGDGPIIIQGTTRDGQKKFELITHRDGKKW